MKYAYAVIMSLALAACTSNNYDTGDGSLSYMRADFVDAHCSEPGMVDYAVADNDDYISLAPQAKASWATTANDMYRSLLYYNKVGDKSEPVGIVRVPVIDYQTASEIGTIPTDPVEFESAWIGENKKYLNVGFHVKTGQADNQDNTQGIGILLDEMVMRPDGGRNICLRLLHSQNGAPQYYSSMGYVSMPLQWLIAGDSIQLTVYTYGGEVVKHLAY